MSLINDMLRDLDARRVHHAAGNLAASPAAVIGTAPDALRTGMAWLLAGVAMLAALVIVVPLLTDHLELFDWDGPGGPAVTRTITLPALAKNEPAHQARRRELHNHAAHRPAVAPAPAESLSTSGATNDKAPSDIPEKTLIQAESVSTSPGDRTTQDIIVHRHGAGNEYRLAAGEAAAGNDRDAIRRLQDLLASNTEHHGATLLLASLHIRQQQLADAEVLLEDALARHPLHAPYARLLAHLLVMHRRHDDAIARLESALPGALRDADYQALLAGLYQRSGKPAAAVQYYTRALELGPQQGEWWMGLGISQEQGGNRDAARTAYRKALQFQLDATLRDYIGKRLRQLTQQAPAAMTNIQPAGRI
jgi:Flp pilus assembly protein TadD